VMGVTDLYIFLSLCLFQLLQCHQVLSIDAVIFIRVCLSTTTNIIALCYESISRIMHVTLNLLEACESQSERGHGHLVSTAILLQCVPIRGLQINHQQPTGKPPLGSPDANPHKFHPRGSDEISAHRGSLSANFSVESTNEDQEMTNAVKTEMQHYKSWQSRSLPTTIQILTGAEVNTEKIMPGSCVMLPEGQRPEGNIAHLSGIIFQCWSRLTVNICFVISRKTAFCTLP